MANFPEHITESNYESSKKKLLFAAQQAGDAGDIPAQSKFFDEAKRLDAKFQDRQPSGYGDVEGFAHSIGEGALWGGKGEATGAIAGTAGALAGEGDYKDLYAAAEAEQRNRQEAFNEESPWLGYGGQIIGNIGSGIGLVAAGAPTLGATWPAAAATLAKVGPLGKALLTNTSLGGLYGTLSGKPGERLKSGVIDAAISAAVPAGASAVGGAMEKVLTSTPGVSSWLARRRDMPALEMMGRNVDDPRVLDVTDEIASNAMIPATSVNPRLVDRSPNALQIAKDMVSAGGESATRMVSKMKGYSDQATGQLRQKFGDVTEALRPVGSYIVKQGENIEDVVKNAISRSYDKAWKQPINWASESGEKLWGLVDSRILQSKHADKIIDDANEMMRQDGVLGLDDFHKIVVPKNWKNAELPRPSLQQLDYMTRVMNKLGKLPDNLSGGSMLKSVKSIRDVLKSEIGEYKDALGLAHRDFEIRDAKEWAAKMFNPGVSAREFLEGIENFAGGAEEKRLIMGAAADYLEDIIGKVKSTNVGNEAEKEIKALLSALSSKTNLGKLRTIAGDAADDLFDSAKTAAQAIISGKKVGEVTAKGVVPKALDKAIEGSAESLSGTPGKVLSRIGESGRLSNTNRSAMVDALTDTTTDSATRMAAAKAKRIALEKERKRIQERNLRNAATVGRAVLPLTDQ